MIHHYHHSLVFFLHSSPLSGKPQPLAKSNAHPTLPVPIQLYVVGENHTTTLAALTLNSSEPLGCLTVLLHLPGP